MALAVVKRFIGPLRLHGYARGSFARIGSSLGSLGGATPVILFSSNPMRQSSSMASGRKSAIVRKLSHDWTAGYAASEVARGATELELLDQAGKVLRIALDQIKWVCYLRELGAAAGDPQNPEKLLQKRFRTRPRTAGLWLRLELVDHDVIEGIVANDASLVRGAGLLLTPPDTRSNTQRIFIPHSAIETLEVVARVGGAEKRRAAATEQPSLFAGSEGDNEPDAENEV